MSNVDNEGRVLVLNTPTCSKCGRPIRSCVCLESPLLPPSAEEMVTQVKLTEEEKREEEKRLNSLLGGYPVL